MFPLLQTVSDTDLVQLLHFEESRGDIQFVEEKEDYTFTMDLPGFKKKEIVIDIKDNYLSIKAERKEDYSQDAKVHYRKSHSNKKSINYSLPNDILADKVFAKLEDGLLKVTFPKKAEAKSKQITIH